MLCHNFIWVLNSGTNHKNIGSEIPIPRPPNTTYVSMIFIICHINTLASYLQTMPIFIMEPSKVEIKCTFISAAL